MKLPSESRLLVCGIVRDAEKGLRKNIPVIKELVAQFADYYVIMYENDSVDGTKTLLKRWMEEDERHVYAYMTDTNRAKTIPSAKGLNRVNPFFSRKRIEKMATFRNFYMEYVEKADEDFDYMIVVDLDVAQLNVDNIMSSFATDAPEWDAVTAYGYSRSPMLKKRYHDTYAMVSYGEEDFPQTESLISKTSVILAKELEIKEWKRVFSAFGGLAIYKYHLIKGLRYKVLPNNDPKVEVRCEHYSIYSQMMERKPDLRVYINSRMQLYYQEVTLKLIWKTIKRMFRG